MLARIRKAQNTRDGGFTLIELLVVVIIIGILAAIAIPTFLKQRENGWKAQAESQLRNAVTNAESYAVNNNGYYDTLASAAGVAAVNDGIRPPANVSAVAVQAAPTRLDYCISLTHAGFTPTKTFNYDKARDTIIEGACA